MIRQNNEKGTVAVSTSVYTDIAGTAASNCFGVRGMAARSVTDGVYHLLRKESMSKGVRVEFHEDDSISVDLHIMVDSGVNLNAVGESIISRVRYEVAKYSGIKVVPTKWSTFVISGVTATLAGILLSSRMNTGNSVYGDTTGMMVNCGCVIGGTSFAGGEGGVIQSFIGLMVVQMLTTCMSALSVDGFWQKLIEGLLIVVIIAADCYSRKLKRERV